MLFTRRRRASMSSRKPLFHGSEVADCARSLFKAKPESVDDLNRNQWTGSTGMGGRFGSERVDDFTRNNQLLDREALPIGCDQGQAQGQDAAVDEQEAGDDPGPPVEEVEPTRHQHQDAA